MDELSHHPVIKIKRKYVRFVRERRSEIQNLFPVRFNDKEINDNAHSNIVHFPVIIEDKDAHKHSKILTSLQNFVDSLCLSEKEGEDIEGSLAGEDSSYDSDFEGEEGKSHQDVSRTVSDTLGAEFAEYVSTNSYAAKVEFGLKLGYTEKLVQTALLKLGPNPGQNELLAELIKLGAQSSKCTELDTDVSELEYVEPVPKLRHIVIDGSNVAMSHGNKEVFSCKGIKICVDWFKARGHKEITVFVPKWRKEASRPDNPVADQDILTELERDRMLVFTPSRLVGGKRTVCYDDRYVLRLALEVDGIVVSNDNYRDLAQEFRKVVEERTLMYSFVNDRFMPPDDPLGRSGPTLDNFLRVQPRKGDPPPPCPYGKKCTYGNKCKYHHPERGPLPHKSVTERLFEHAHKQMQARGSRDSSPGGLLKGKSLSVPLNTEPGVIRKAPLSRTRSNAPCPSSSMTDNEKVCKSKSVENIISEGKVYKSLPQSQISPNQPPPYWGARPDWSYSTHSSLSQKLSDPESNSEHSTDMAGNLHRKLQRQLTLNPNYDPRLCQLRRYVGPNPPHLPVERHCSGGEYATQYWDHQLHQNVTRIASAPDSYHPAPPQPVPQRQMHRMGSTSDPQLNLCVPDPGAWLSSQQLVYPVHVPQFPNMSTEEARRKLHYHLASIFPEEQVRTALQMYPDETNPQKICAAILSMFPKP